MRSLNKSRLILEQPETRGGETTFAARIEHLDGTRDRLWWRLPEVWTEAVTAAADPFVVGLVFPMMQRGAPVHVEGTVSPSLLANLELFMRIWEIWYPGKYRPLDLTAEKEAEMPPISNPGRRLVSFSGGVDSCFTAYRHARGLAGRRSHPLAAGVFLHGFDVWLDEKDSRTIYERLLADCTVMLESIGLPCIPMATNFQKMRLDWADAWGTQLASGMTLLSGHYDGGFIANDIPYHWMDLPWPIHPISTHLLGSGRFSIADDGGECTRTQKARLIAAWPEAMRHLHVCFSILSGKADNCCRCEKCVRTILAFRIAGCDRPAAFAEDPDERAIRAVRLTLETRRRRWQQLHDEAVAAGFGNTGWAHAIRSVIRRYRYRQMRNRFQAPFVPLRNAFRLLTRGTTLSRRERQAEKDANQP